MNIYAITDASGNSVDKYEIDQKLEDLGIPEDVIQEGESSIQQYADAQGIDLGQVQTDEAKKTSMAGSSVTAKEDYSNNLKTLGIPEDVISQGQNAIQIYAEQNGIKLPQSKGTQMNLLS